MPRFDFEATYRRRAEDVFRWFQGCVIFRGGVAWMLTPVPCGVAGCTLPAVKVDPFAPYHNEASRCRRHAPTAGQEDDREVP